MSERPILFNDAMVRAILAGTKTQTRRPVRGNWDDVSDPERPPPAEVGDTLWVRECWRVGGIRDPWRPPSFEMEERGCRSPTPGLIACDYRATPEVVRTPWATPPHDVFERLQSDVWASAKRKGIATWGHGESPDRWRPSIHMPRWASRLSLRVTDVRVQALQDISERDACADGGHSPITRDCKVPKFAALWNDVYGTWDANPWVWAITFEVAP